MNFFQLMFGEWLELLFGFRGRINRAKSAQTPAKSSPEIAINLGGRGWSAGNLAPADRCSRSGLPPDDGLKYLRPPLRDVGYFSGCVLCALRALGLRQTHRENPREPEDGEEQGQ